jgi:imidazoleglycerol-phosphate dehydratase
VTKIERETKETQIECVVEKDGIGEYNIDTGIGFFDHMLEALSKHSGIDIFLKCKGDLHIDAHHSVEDCGIVLGKALKDEIFPIKNVERFADVKVVMDEACSACAIDLSNRSYLVYEADLHSMVGNFDLELVEEFFMALVSNFGITCHIENIRGKNKHHISESIFKSFAVALRRALIPNDKLKIPSTKGVL